jgi:hypothetical protein
MEGQINLGTPFGNEIYNICKNTAYKPFVRLALGTEEELQDV